MTSPYKKILVTGGSAVAGGALKDVAESEYPEREFIFPSSHDFDLTALQDTIRMIDTYRPNAIIHFAARSGGIGISGAKPATLLRDNVLMNIHIMEAARIFGVPKTVMTLSTGMYPANAPIPLKESSLHDGVPHPSVDSYAFAKRLIEPMIRAYRTEYGLSVIGLTPNAIVGERSNFNPEASTMVPALVRRFYENRNSTKPITVWGDGSPLREITYGKDIARAFMWCLDRYDGTECLNIGTTEEASVKDIAFMIADAMDIDRNRIAFDATKPAGQFRKSTDNSLFTTLSHFRYTPIRETLKKTINYFFHHYPDQEKLRL